MSRAGATPGRSAASSAHERRHDIEPGAAGGRRGDGARVRLRRGRARARRRCSSSASSAPCAMPATTSTRSSSSPTRARRPGSCAPASAERLRDRGRHDLARALDGAWISTIHGFCSRLLKAHPFAVGLDPRFREIDDAGAAVLRGEAFERALTAFCAEGEPERLRLLATYGAAGLRRMLTSVYETLRSAGRELVLELGERPSLPAALEAWREAAEMPRRRSARHREPATKCCGGESLSRGRRRSPSACSTSARCAAAASGPRRTSRRAVRSSAPRSRSSRPGTAISCRSC